MKTKTQNKPKTKDDAQIAHFAKTSKTWWDECGPFAPLHRLNPARIQFLRDQIAVHFGHDALGALPLSGLTVLDIGSGGGLVCEPLARLGAQMTGIDADPQASQVAACHAEEQGLPIDYVTGAAEDLIDQEQTYDVVLALEVIEHVSDPAGFVEMCSALVRSGGIVIFSTLNRTWKSYALGIVMAEKVLQWVPDETHDWKRFLKPSELARLVRATGDLEVCALSGLTYNPLSKRFALNPSDLGVNYFLVAQKS